VPQIPVLNDEQALSKFYKQFPPISDLSKVLEQLHQLASDKGVNLSNGEYKLSNDANNPNLMRYEIIFPVQASYKNLRDFIAAASQQFPTLGLAEVNLKRESVKDTAVQIKLSYVLLLVRSR
jgi:Tfp pilus assembly protein PilO